MAILNFLDGRKTKLMDFWRLDEHDIPDSSGVYILIAKPSHTFPYPRGRSPVFYIGQSKCLRKRLNRHLYFSKQARYERTRKEWLYWPRYEYAAKFGSRYCFVRTAKHERAKHLEDKIMASFAKQYM